MKLQNMATAQLGFPKIALNLHESEAVVSALQIYRRLRAIFKMADQQALQLLKKDDLKTWLKARALKVSGTKQDLITCASKAKHDGTELLTV